MARPPRGTRRARPARPGIRSRAARTAGEPATKRRVIVRFHDSIHLSAGVPITDTLEADALGPWLGLVAAFGPITVRPLFAQSPAKLAELAERAAALHPGSRAPRLQHYYALQPSAAVDAHHLARALSMWPTIKVGYAEPLPSVPPAVNADDPRRGEQGYLDPAPKGIDAEFAWLLEGGDGDGQGFVDLEQGWNFNHEDLQAHAIALIAGISKKHIQHGTNVLGVVASVDNDKGGIGVAPNVSSVRCVSQWASDGTYSTAPAVVNALEVMATGDVLLLEAQVSMWGHEELPVEAEPAVFEAIRLATLLGIIVVEAAGNGGGEEIDLDQVVDGQGEFIFRRTVRDSGAIVVAGALKATGLMPASFSRLPGCCYGSRVDCFAWGQGVVTADTDATGFDNGAYYSFFSGSSSAAAIVAGAALVVQGISEAATGRLDPHQMRALLADPLLGTPKGGSGLGIGVMPDLRAILGRQGLNLAPDVYLRDFVGDTGDPHPGAVSASPDIVLRQKPLPNPAAALGEGSGTEDDDALSQSASAGHDNYLYVRLRNRGGTAASDVRVTLFWAPPATLLSPDLWTLVGTTRVASVPSGNLLTVSDAIVWPASAVPATGHYCFVAAIDHAFEPAPPPAWFTSWAEFVDYVRAHRNVTWRNFNVVELAPSAGVPLELTFAMAGSPDGPSNARLEIVAHVPDGASLELDVPRALFASEPRGDPEALAGGDRDRLRLPVNPRGTTRFLPIRLSSRAFVALRLILRAPKDHRGHPFELSARQWVGAAETGRVTWRVVPERAAAAPRSRAVAKRRKR